MGKIRALLDWLMSNPAFRQGVIKGASRGTARLRELGIDASYTPPDHSPTDDRSQGADNA